MHIELYIGKNMAILYASRYRGYDTICCNTVSKEIYSIFLVNVILGKVPQYKEHKNITFFLHRISKQYFLCNSIQWFKVTQNEPLSQVFA